MDFRQTKYCYEYLVISQQYIFAALAACKLAGVDYKAQELPNGDYNLKWQLPYGEDELYLRCILENIAK